MKTTIAISSLITQLKLDHPNWVEDAVSQAATDYLAKLDERLIAALAEFLNTGIKTDFMYGEFSVFQIQALRHDCPYLEALALMSAYLANPLDGKAQILRR